MLWFQPFSFPNKKENIKNPKHEMLATHHHSPSILPLPAQSIHPDMATDGTRVHFCVDSWTLHLKIMLKHCPRNPQIMKVLQARVPLDFVFHCSNRLRPHRWSCLSFKHIETLTLFRSPQIFAAVSPLTMTSFVPGGQNWDPFEADWMHWVPNKSKSDRSG